MIFKKLIPFLLILSIFASCSDIDSSDNREVAVEASTSSDEVSIKVSLDSGSERTALPTLDKTSLTYISLRYKKSDSSDDYKTLSEWDSADSMSESTLSLAVGTYDFFLMAFNSATLLTADKDSVQIVGGTNELSFSPVMAYTDTSVPGKGSLNVRIRFDGTNVRAVTAGLYNLDSTPVQGFSDETLSGIGGGDCSYIKEGDNQIPNGNYIVVFKFYADEAKTQSLGMYREYATIVANMTSTSSCVVESLANLFTIEYELNGGSFGSSTVPGSYTRKSSAVTLPSSDNLSKSGYFFQGWYENRDFSGDMVLSIPAGSTGNKKYYAKWVQWVTVTFNENNAGSSIQTTTQNLLKGEEEYLLTATALVLVSPVGKYFRGWATSPTASEPLYKDGQKVILSENTHLYAIWSVSKINPQSETDTTDSDGDGISDYDEIHKYLTDPQSKDTDGDGWTDGEELSLYNSNTLTFSPLIADTPKLRLVMTETPSISYKYSKTDSDSRTETESMSGGRTGSASNTNSNTHSFNESTHWSEKFSIRGKISAEPELEVGVEESAGKNYVHGDSYTYSSSESSGWSTGWTNGKSKTESSSTTLTEATIKVPVSIVNESSVLSYTISNATFTINRLSNASSKGFVPVGSVTENNLGTIQGGGKIERTISLVLANTDVGKELEQLLKYSNGISIELSGYTLKSFKDSPSAANDFTKAYTEIAAKTATVYLDWAPSMKRSRKIWSVAVKNQYNVNATSIDEQYAKQSLEYILVNILKMSKDSVLGYTVNAGGMIKSIYGVETVSQKNGYWSLSHEYTKNGQRKKDFYPFGITADNKIDLNQIYVNAGDIINIVYDVDNDEDGLPSNEELIRGTSDSNKDSDGDGLSDWEEAYGWYKSYLDSKYSESNKVCTNPTRQDTDGDDLLDYSTDSTKRDPDPIVEKQKDDTSLSVIQYSTDGKTYTDFSFDNDGKASLSVQAESIYLNIEPKLLFSTLEYRTSATDSYKHFYSKAKQNLPIGSMSFQILCTAPDRTTTKTYTLTVNSDFNPMTNFKAISEGVNDGVTAVTWDYYSDSRTQIEENKVKQGGYVLYAIKTTKSADKSLAISKESAFAAPDKIDNKVMPTLGSFYLKLKDETLKAQSISLSLKANTDYAVYLFAFCNANNNFSQTLLGCANVHTGKSKEAKLKIWLHDLIDEEDDDGGYDPNYFWTWENGDDKLNFESANLKENATFDFDIDGTGECKYYCFGNKTPYDYTCKIERFHAPKKLEGSYSREKNHTITVRLKVQERDPGSNNDTLAQIEIKFMYNSSEDKWYCNWYVIDRGNENSGTTNAKTISIGCGQRSDMPESDIGKGNKNPYWDVHNSDCGKVYIRWDWAWDYGD